MYCEIRLDRDKEIELKISPGIDNNHIWHWDTNWAAVSFNSSLPMSVLSISTLYITLRSTDDLPSHVLCTLCCVRKVSHQPQNEILVAHSRSQRTPNHSAFLFCMITLWFTTSNVLQVSEILWI